MALPDTKGQWKYVTYDISQVIQIDGDYSLLYMNVKGAGTTVDIDHINVKAGTQLTPPAFKAGNSDLNTFSFVGAPSDIWISPLRIQVARMSLLMKFRISRKALI